MYGRRSKWCDAKRVNFDCAGRTLDGIGLRDCAVKPQANPLPNRKRAKLNDLALNAEHDRDCVDLRQGLEPTLAFDGMASTRMVPAKAPLCTTDVMRPDM